MSEETKQDQGVAALQAADAATDVGVPLYRGRPVGEPTPQKLPYPAEFWPGCPCKACVPADANPFSFHAQMHLCPSCGNKRCPGAADHTRTCSGSNEPGQPGSLYENKPPVCVCNSVTCYGDSGDYSALDELCFACHFMAADQVCPAREEDEDPAHPPTSEASQTDE